MLIPIMTILDFFTKIYGRLHSSRLHYSFLTPFRVLVRKTANKILPFYLSKPHNLSDIVVEDLIVSFTTFPARIGEVWQVVECMFRQTYLPKKIILWLSKEQFPSKNDIPESLLCRECERFEIRYVEGDIKSHKKYFYMAEQFTNKYVFLIDDDIYYPTTLIEDTWKYHVVYPNAVICNYGYHIEYERNGVLKPYNKWDRIYSASYSDAIFFGSGGGTLIKPSSLYTDLNNIDLALRMTPIADDIWLNAMVNLANLKKVLLKNRLILPIYIKGDTKLASQNRENNQNDKQLNNVIDYYTNNIGENPFKASQNY